MTKPLRWGLVGGGQGSQIGDAHRIAARLDGLFALTAGALDVDAERGRACALSHGVADDRAYGTWQEMLTAERARVDGIDLVTVATPNATHFEIARAFLDAGIHVLCEKPMTMEEADAARLVEAARKSDCVLAVNFGYSGYPMVREARARVARGDLGKVRLVVAEFAHGFYADGEEADNPRVRWRFDPEQAGVSSVLADCGIHAMHMIGYITGQNVRALSADFDSLVAGRELEDDAAVALRYDGGAKARIWASGVAVGQMHGLNIRIFGERGGLRWRQERPNQLHWTSLGGQTTVLERGAPELSQDAAEASRTAIGHSEGMLVAFANVYRDLHAAIQRDDEGTRMQALGRLPLGEAGAEMVSVVHAAVESAGRGGAWVDLDGRPGARGQVADDAP